jgi:hypothetical protein
VPRVLIFPEFPTRFERATLELSLTPPFRPVTA